MRRITHRTRARRVGTLLGALVAAVTVLPVGSVSAGSTVVHDSVVSEDPVDWTPHALNGTVTAIIPLGDRVIVAGNFTSTRNQGTQTEIPRSHIFAFDAATGEIDPDFAPLLDGPVAAAVADPSGQFLYLGGNFNYVNGVKRRKIAKIDATTGQTINSFKAAADLKVMDITYANGLVYAAGQFLSINNHTGSVARAGLAALDPTTGAVSPTVNVPFSGPIKGPMNVRNIDITPDGSRLVAVGNFTFAAGQDRFQIAVLDLTTDPAALANWHTNSFKQPCNNVFNTYMRDVDVAPDGTWFVVGTTGSYSGGPPKLCDSVSRWELTQTGTGLNPTWVDYAGGDTTTQVEVVGGVVYVGGHQRWVNNPYAGDSPGPGTFPVEGLAALAPDNGMPFTWNPTRERGYGVATFVPTEDGLWIGSDTGILAGEFHGRLGFLPLDGGIAPPASRPARFPNDLHAIHIQNGNNNDPWLRRTYAGSGAFGAAGTIGTPWENVRGVFALNGNLYMGWSDGKIYERSFDGSSIGGATALNLYGLDSAPGGNRNIPGTNTNIPSLTTQIKNATGLAYQQGRMYYTVQGEPRLYMRYFNPQSEVIGGELFVTSTGDGVDWPNVRGFTIADGQLYFAKTDNRLYRVAFADGRPTGPVTQISGSGIDGNQWQSRGMFVFKQTTDTFAPTTPGTPSGTSTLPGEVDLSWAASSDSASDTITYRVFREGVQVGEVSSDASGTIAFTDTTAPTGATVTYRIDARDAANNASALSPASSGIVVAAPDTTPPSVPGQPTGEALSRSKIRVTWAASTDDHDTELTYRVYRDGEEVGQVVSSSGTTVTFDDTGLASSTAYVYTVDAADGKDNVSDLSIPSDPVLTLGVIFADDFSSGDLTSWHEVDDMTIDGTRGSPSAPSVRAETSLNGAVLRHDLETALPAACASTRVSVEVRQGSGGVDVALDLFRLRTTGNGALMRVLVDSSGDLAVRNDTASSGATLSSGVPLPSGWNEVELCGTTGVGGSWTLSLNGSTVIDAWVTDTPDTGIARLQLGDPGAKTITANWDDVVIDSTPG